MATVTAFTSVTLTEAQRKEIVKGIGEAVKEAYNFTDKSKSIMLIPLPPENVCDAALNQTTLIVWTAPNKPIEQKRKLVKLLNDNIVMVTGYQGEMKVIVIIKEHPAENVGVDGVLRSDV